MQILTASATLFFRDGAASYLIAGSMHTYTDSLKDMRETVKNTGDLDGTLLYIKFEVRKFEVKQLQSLKNLLEK